MAYHLATKNIHIPHSEICFPSFKIKGVTSKLDFGPNFPKSLVWHEPKFSFGHVKIKIKVYTDFSYSSLVQCCSCQQCSLFPCGPSCSLPGFRMSDDRFSGHLTTSRCSMTSTHSMTLEMSRFRFRISVLGVGIRTYSDFLSGIRIRAAESELS